MTILWGILGCALLAGVSVDVFYTVLTGRGGGWLTNLLTRTAWQNLLRVHDKRPIHTALAIAGPLLILSVVLIWYVIAVIAWTLIFYSSENSIVDSHEFPAIGFSETLFFVGVTFSTLGYGNLIPNGMPWTVLGNLTALTGTILLTAALSYVLSVLHTSIERRQLAAMINTVGETPAQFIERAWCGPDRGVLDDHVVAIANQVSKHAEKHVNYPILQYFHSDRWEKAPAPAALLFSDAMFLARYGLADDDRPARSLLHLCEASITNYLAQTRITDGLRTAAGERDPDTENVPESLELSQLRTLGLATVSREEFESAFRDYASRREGLIELAHNDGWTPTIWPPEEAEDLSTNRVCVIGCDDE